LLATSGLRGALLVDAVSFVLAAMLLFSLPRKAPPRERSGQSGSGGRLVHLGAELRQGLAYVIHTAVPRAVTFGLFLATLFVALDNVALVFLAQRTLHSGPAGYSALLAGYGAGMIAASLLMIPASRRLSTQVNLLIGVAVMGLGTALCGVSPTLGLALAAEVMVGIGNGFQNITNDTLLQQTTPHTLLGRVFGVAYSAPYLALLITYTAGGALLQATSPRIALLIAGLGTLGVTAIIWQQLRGRQTSPLPLPIDGKGRKSHCAEEQPIAQSSSL
jgi:MFS family permease